VETIPKYDAMQETVGMLRDVRQSHEDFASGDTFDAAQVNAELAQRRRTS
jgi:hypothetical protein